MNSRKVFLRDGHCRVNWQVRNQRKCSKNSRFGVGKLSFSLGLAFILTCTFLGKELLRLPKSAVMVFTPPHMYGNDSLVAVLAAYAASLPYPGFSMGMKLTDL